MGKQLELNLEKPAVSPLKSASKSATIKSPFLKPKALEKEELFDNLITIRELADYIGVSPKTVQNWVAYRTIPFVRVGGKTRFRRSRIETWLQTKEFEPCL